MAKYETNSKELNKKIKSVPKVDMNQSGITDDGIATDIANLGEVSQVDLSSIQSFSQVAQTREQIYQLLDLMGEDPTICAMLETYAEDATERNNSGEIIWVESSDTTISKYITYLIKTLQFDKNIYKYAYSLCKYGDLYLQLFKQSDKDKEDDFFKKNTKIEKLNEDVKINVYKESDHYIHYIEMIPNAAEMFDLTKYGKTAGYIKADVATTSRQQQLLYNATYQYKFNTRDINLYDGDKFVHAALEDNLTRNPEEVKLFKDTDSLEDENKGITYRVKHGQSLMYNWFKTWRVLSLLENSMLLNRVTKSSILRLINVEIGDMPKEKVSEYLRNLKSLMEQKTALDAGDSISNYTNPGPIENNIYIPTRNGQGQITSTQVGGDINVGQLPDIDYFRQKFYGASGIPAQYLGFIGDNAGFSGGESLAEESARYAKRVKRIQSTLIQAITDVINLFLIDKGYSQYLGKFIIKMQTPMTKEEKDRIDGEVSRIGVVSDTMNLLGDIEDPIIKLRALKTLLARTLGEDELVELLQEAIDNQQEGISETPVETDSETSPFRSSGLSDTSSSFDNEPLNLDAELGLETEPVEELEDTFSSEQTAEEGLPTPEELTGGEIDFTDNNAQ